MCFYGFFEILQDEINHFKENDFFYDLYRKFIIETKVRNQIRSLILEFGLGSRKGVFPIYIS